MTEFDGLSDMGFYRVHIDGFENSPVRVRAIGPIRAKYVARVRHGVRGTDVRTVEPY